ncbi:sphingosine-1-phosphate phosphohydrolase-like protein [Calycina marina]|uniref:Sphingosine-1-phosphate phosphohydrolase-like protein n=1 Tax=Calycina marina TaxID=1763456 RepID=A0A9P7Z5A2_9HELO|nr:sphingosine-1-phosphate phosphohydrolase-like protein [Calycina marina]
MCPSNAGAGLVQNFPDNTSSLPAPPISIPITAPKNTNETREVNHNGDAGLRSLDHYKRKLSPWRYSLRQKLLPLIRWETPYLAWMQHNMRSPALDTYFAITANLGTHTFFMVVLPILFWCGHTSLGRGMVHILAAGVFFTGFLKDMLSLPRPLSPPLYRITMSGSAALEYGFPSTHSANAVSVAVYALFTLRSPECQLADSTKLILEVLSYSYAFSIVLGRLYCGMHGFMDVIVGSIMGAAISVVQCVYVSDLDRFLHSSSWMAPATLALVILLLIRIHPEPADDCPCFDDSVAFMGVYIGIELGGWHYATGNSAWNFPVPGTVPFSLQHMGWVVVILRVLVGVLVVFAWREVMKPSLLKFLPHLFRLIENYGFILPRKFFMPASKYKNIPARLKVDNVMPSVSDLPSLITSIRHPGRNRSVSVGPQSAADAYETLAYREKRRRDSLTLAPNEREAGSSNRSLNRQSSMSPVQQNGLRSTRSDDDQQGMVSQASGNSSSRGAIVNKKPQAPGLSRLGSFEQQMGQGHVTYTPSTPAFAEDEDDDAEIMVGQEVGIEEKEIFSRLEQPRSRYDVEVVTKLVVYTGKQSYSLQFTSLHLPSFVADFRIQVLPFWRSKSTR